MSEAGRTEELAVEAAAAVLEAAPSELEAQLASVDEATATLRRPYLEAVTMLAWALPADPASVSGRARLLARLHGDETVRVERPQLRSAAAAVPASSPHGALDPPAPPAGGPAARTPPTPARTRPAIPVVSARPPARSYRWALPLAAAFALAALGLALHDRRVGLELEGTRAELAASRAESEQLALRVRSSGPTLEAAASTEAKMREVESQLALVTAGGTAVCPLRPSPGSAAANAGGVLFVAEDHQHWYLRAQKLPHPGAGRVYVLWFLVGEQPVAAGTFEMVGEEAVLSSPTMPQGTSAALVTIEPQGPAGKRPTGPVALYGHRMTRLI